MISINITAETPELLAAHVAWLNAKIGGNEVIAEVKAERTAKKAIEKAASKTESAVSPVTPAATEVESSAPVETASSINADKAAVQKLAQSKAKTSGAEAVKDCICKFGGTNINSTPANKLAELKGALEALA